MEVLLRDDALDQPNREFLAVYALQRLAECRVIRPGPANPRDFGRCVLLAADAFVRFHKVPAERWQGGVRYVCRALGEWHEWVRGLADRFLQLREHERLPTLEEAVLMHWHSINNTLGIPRMTSQFITEVRKQNERLGLPSDPASVLQDLRVFRRLTLGSRDGGAFIGEDRRMRIGWTQYRDTMASFHGIPREPSQLPTARDARGAETEEADWSLEDLAVAPAEDHVREEELDVAVRAALAALPSGVAPLIQEIQEGLDAQALFDGLERAARSEDPAEQAAILRLACDRQIPRESLAEVFDTTVAKVRTAEEKIRV